MILKNYLQGVDSQAACGRLISAPGSTELLQFATLIRGEGSNFKKEKCEMPLLKPSVSEHDHSQGGRSAIATLVEYGDYECPYCGDAYPEIKRVQLHFGKDLRFVFRNFPLSQPHPHALAAAVAAEAAGQQGKFWEMHDILFENQSALGKRSLLSYGGRLGLNLERFGSDLMNEALLLRVRSDFKSGIQSGVNGTPSFYLNDAKLENMPLQEAIDAELSKARSWRAI